MALSSNGSSRSGRGAGITQFLTPDDDLPPRMPEVRRGPPPVEPTDFSTVPDQDADPAMLEEIIRRTATSRRAAIPPIGWANDIDQPDFAHLLVAESKGIKPPKTFTLTPAVLDLLIEANAFKPMGPDDTFVFALRGGSLSTGREFIEAESVSIDNGRPDHENFHCTIGFYHRAKRKLTAFMASTVPNRHYMENYYRQMHNISPYSNTGANIMPSGCYVFRINAHKGGTIKPALRMTDPDKLTEDALATVLRTSNDLVFKHDDFWETTQPYDNVHCAYFTDKFSSAGCQTILGKQDDASSPWGHFQNVLRAYPWDTRIDYMLLTGQDAAIAAELIVKGRQNDRTLLEACLRRLRLGSQGDAVTLLQQKLGAKGTGYFGAVTRMTLVNAERAAARGINSDGIYSPQDDEALGWGVFSGAPAATGTGGTASAGTGAGAGQTSTGGASAASGSPPPAGSGAGLDPASLVLVDGPQGASISADGKQLTVPGEGLWSVGPVPGKITFTPEPGFAGKPQPVRYQISDSYGNKATAQVAVNVVPLNRPPELKPDFARTVSEEAVSVAVLQNDVDLDGHIDPATVRFVSPSPTAMLTADGKTLTVLNEGVWSAEANGDVRFAPMAGFLGNAVATYQVADDKGATATSTVTVTVDPRVAPPQLADDTADTPQGQAISIDVLANDALGAVIGQSTSTTSGAAAAGTGAGGTPPGTGGATDPGATGAGTGTATSGIDVSGAGTGATAGAGAAGAGAAGGAGTTGTGQTGTTGTALPIEVAAPLKMEDVRRFAPHGKDGYMQALATQGDTIFAKYGINATPMRLAHFMAQIGHESGGFTVERESLNYTTSKQLMKVWPKRFPTVESTLDCLRNEQNLAARVYDNRPELGNTSPGDGFKYRGRGLIQLTGHGPYSDMGRQLGLDLENNPDLAFQGDHALRIAAQDWENYNRPGQRTMNELADANEIEIITKRINGGLTGLDSRLQHFAAAWTIWGNGPVPVGSTTSDIIERGQSGERVRKLQEMLQRAGYDVGTIDGVFGGGTQKAVILFQNASKLNANGIVDKTTWTLLEKAPAAAGSAQAPQAKPATGMKTGAGQRPSARDPGAVRRSGGDAERGGRAEPGQGGRPTGAAREIVRLIAVVLGVAAIATFNLLTISSGPRESGASPAPEGPLSRVLEIMADQHWIPALLLAAAVLLWLITLAMPRGRASLPYRDAAPAGSMDMAPPAGNSAIVFDAPSDADTGPETMADHEPTATRSASRPGDHEILRKLGFDPSDFVDKEPIRAAPPLAEEVVPVNSSSGEQPLHALVPGGVGGRAGGAIVTRNPGMPDSGLRPFPVADPNSRYAILAMFGGDNNLSGQVPQDLKEMAAGNSTGGVTSVLALADFENAPASVIEITPQGQMRTIEQLGEIDTGDPETLAHFLSRALATFPSARKAIGFWDHGSGVFDENDPNQKILTRAVGARRSVRGSARRLFIPAAKREALMANPATRGMLHDNSGGVLTNLEAGHMLRAAFQRAGNPGPVDVIYSDTCLNGMVEVVEELGDFSRCVVASCETEPSDGWDYQGWLSRTSTQQPQTPEIWCKHAIEAFAMSYQSRSDQHPCTLSAFRSQNDITERFADLVSTASQKGLAAWSLLNMARGRTQQYDSRDSYDLIDFANRLTALAQTELPELGQRAQALSFASRQARVGYCWLGHAVQASQGLAFWFPSSAASLEADIGTYQQLRFSKLTNWAGYLEKMYKG